MNEPKKRGRPARVIETTPWKHDETGIIPPIVSVPSVKTETRAAQCRETLDVSVVYRVEAEIGRTANAWGMVDPLELIRAVDRVLRGGRHE